MQQIQQAQGALQQKNFDEVLKLTEEALASSASDPKVFVYGNLFRAMALQSLNRCEEAIEAYETVMPKLPKLDGSFLMNKGQAHQKLGQFEKALDCYTKIPADDKQCPEPTQHFLKGSVLDDLNRLGEALDEYILAVKLNPADIRFHKNKGIIEQKLEKYDDALKSFETVYKGGDASVCASIGRIQYLKKNYQEALKKFDELLSKDPSNFNCLLYKADLLKDQKKYDDATKIYEQLSSAQPDNYDVVFSKATLLDDQKKYKEAAEAYEKAIQLKPNEAPPYYNRGNMLKALNKNDEAVQMYQKALEINSQYKDALNNLGSVYQSLKKYDEAIKCYDQFLSIEDSEHVHNNKGNALKNKKEYEKALKEFELALKIRPKYILGLTNQAQVKIAMSNKQSALEDLKKVDELLEDKENYKDLSDENVDFIRKSVKKIIEIEKQFAEDKKKIEDELKKQDQSNPEVQKITNKLNELEKQKEEGAAKALDNISKSSTAKDDSQNMNASYFSSEMAELRQMMMKMQQRTAQLAEKQSELKEEQKKVEQQVESQEKVMQDAGVYDKANIKLKFDEFQKDAPECYNYSKTFYWTFINFCDALRLASTGVFQKDNDFQENEKASLGVKAASGVLSLGAKVPVFGSLFELMDNAIGAIYEKYKEMQYQQKYEAINAIIINNQDSSAATKEGWSMMVAKASQEIAERKKGILADQEIYAHVIADKSDQDTLTRAISWLKDQVNKVKEVATGPTVELYETVGGKEAYADVLLILSFMFKEHQTMIKSPYSLHQQISNIVIRKEQVGMLKQMKLQEYKKKEKKMEEKKQQEEEKRQQSSCCILM